jgi:hypothetical protein
MTIEIIDRISHPKGRLYRVRIDTHTINVLLLSRAIERMKKWGISPHSVPLPSACLPVGRGRGEGEGELMQKEINAFVFVLVTVYFPYADRYFKGGRIYENKIFKGN